MEYESTILIVDDEPYGRENLQDILITQGYNLAFAANGPECLAKAAELTPDVILLDVMMPGMDGFEVCRRLRTHPILAEVPIILVTALDDRESRLIGIESGADDFISKPLDRVELRTRLRSLTRLNRYRRLLSQRARFSWVADRAEDAYLIISSEDEMLYANAQARQFLNLSADQAIEPNQKFLDLAQTIYQCTPPEAWESWPQPTTKSETIRHLVRPESLVNQSSWLQVDVEVGTGSNQDGFLVRLHDVTAQIIEERLQWAFHAQISHKLKTPLTHVISAVELLMNESADLGKEQRDTFLAMVYKASLQLQQNLAGIFNFVEAPDMAHPERGAATLAELSETIYRVCQELDIMMVQVDFEGFAELEDSRLALSQRSMEMVFHQLISNAKKFHSTQAPSITVTITNTSDGAQIRVRDNGTSLSADQLAKIWAPYYQIEKYFTGQVPGMGLGLSIVAAIISEIEGRYRAFNQGDPPGLVIELVIPLAAN